MEKQKLTKTNKKQDQQNRTMYRGAVSVHHVKQWALRLPDTHRYMRVLSQWRRLVTIIHESETKPGPERSCRINTQRVN